MHIRRINKMIPLIFLVLLVIGMFCLLFSFVGMTALLTGALIPLTITAVVKVFMLGFILILVAFIYMGVTAGIYNIPKREK